MTTSLKCITVSGRRDFYQWSNDVSCSDIQRLLESRMLSQNKTSMCIIYSPGPLKNNFTIFVARTTPAQDINSVFLTYRLTLSSSSMHRIQQHPSSSFKLLLAAMMQIVRSSVFPSMGSRALVLQSYLVGKVLLRLV